MSHRKRARVTPHRTAVDLSSVEGVTVLGESLAVLFSALLRLQLGPPRDGLADMSATLPSAEGEAIERAMVHAEREIPGDSRSPGQRDADRFMAVAERVFETVEAIHASGSQGPA